MSFADRVLEPPRYGYIRDGKFYRPTRTEIFLETCFRLNPFKRHNWLAVVSFCAMLVFFFSLWIFITRYFSWPIFFAGYLYASFVMGSHANFWIHRYCVHRAFYFSHPFYRAVCRNLVIKAVPEEIYVISHHVHHQIADEPGDPYNPQGGWLYCFLADFNHQAIRRDLGESEYKRMCGLMSHTGVRMNDYAGYSKWGSICHPVATVGHYLLNWTIWFGVFYLIGGLPLAFGMFGMASFWAISYRTVGFNFHGRGGDRRIEGREFCWDDYSVNKLLPGIITGEWHNNHHLYPGSARSGFLPHQLDLPFLGVRLLSLMGWVSSYRDSKELFFKNHWQPYLLRKANEGSGLGSTRATLNPRPRRRQLKHQEQSGSERIPC